jgi:hypothetical protein
MPVCGPRRNYNRFATLYRPAGELTTAQVKATGRAVRGPVMRRGVSPSTSPSCRECCCAESSEGSFALTRSNWKSAPPAPRRPDAATPTPAPTGTPTATPTHTTTAAGAATATPTHTTTAAPTCTTTPTPTRSTHAGAPASVVAEGRRRVDDDDGRRLRRCRCRKREDSSCKQRREDSGHTHDIKLQSRPSNSNHTAPR